MAVELLDLAAVETRLLTLVPATAKHVGRLVALQTPDGTLGTLHRALLIARTATQIPGPTGLGRGRILTERFAVVVQINRATAADAGGTVDAEGADLREAVIACLEAWRPGAGWSPVIYRGGSLWESAPPVYRWIDGFSTEKPVN